MFAEALWDFQPTWENSEPAKIIPSHQIEHDPKYNFQYYCRNTRNNVHKSIRVEFKGRARSVLRHPPVKGSQIVNLENFCK